MLPTAVALRVHFAGLEELQVGQVVGPLLEQKADMLYLLRGGSGEREQGEEVARQFVREKLHGTPTEVREILVDFDDPASIAHAVGNVVDQAPENDYRYNLSTGPRGAVVGGFLAAQFWPIIPYMAHVDPDAPPEDSRLELHPYKGMEEVSTVRYQKLSPEAIESLGLLASSTEPVPQRNLIKHLEKHRHIRPRRDEPDRGPPTPLTQTDELSPQAKQAQFQTIIRQLKAKGLAEREGEGKRSRWRCTDEGRLVHKILKGA